MKRKIEETLPASNKESRIDDTQVFEYEIEDPILLKIIECARNRNHEELQRIPNLDINKMDYKIGLSAVAILANNEEVEAIKFLEPYGINKNLLVYGFAMGGHGEHMKKLLNQGTSKDFTIAGAARGGQKELVEWLLSQGASKDHAVAGAVRGRHKELVKWLVSQGACKDNAVEEAIDSGQKKLLEWLVSQGVNKDWAVEIAGQGGHKEMVEWLISQGACKDKAVKGAAQCGHRELVGWLVSQGAYKDKAVKGAVQYGHNGLVEWLISQGACKDKAVKGAAQYGHKELVEWLLNLGADKDKAVIKAIVGHQYRLAIDIINNHRVHPPVIDDDIDDYIYTQLNACFNIRYNAYSFISGINNSDLQQNYITFISDIIDVSKFSRYFGNFETTMELKNLSIQDAYVYYVEKRFIKSKLSTPLGDYVASFYNSYKSAGLMVMGETKEIIIPNEILNKIAYFYLEHPKLKHNDTTNAQVYPHFSERVVDKVVSLWVNRIREIRSSGNMLSSDSIGK